MAFRYLAQKVPEFQTFCEVQAKKLGISSKKFEDNDIRLLPGPKTEVEGKDFLAARIIGRWPNGIQWFLARRGSHAENYRYPNHTNRSCSTSIRSFGHSAFDDCIRGRQAERLPYSAHIRKTAHRIVNDQIKAHSIMRRGIQFGDEVRAGERERERESTF